MYTAKQVSKILGLSDETIYKYLERGLISHTFEGSRYAISEENLFDLLDSEPRILYLMDHNPSKSAKELLQRYKDCRNYETVYHVLDLADVCHKTHSWARALIERGHISGTYVRETEVVNYLKKRPDIIDGMVGVPCKFSACEILRVQLLARLKKEGYV